ncbi:MAG TPA: endonuclease, partial [Saprospiraceae bacterium]|nr:endonuclease [Saprospiraceae bacterium]
MRFTVIFTFLLLCFTQYGFNQNQYKVINVGFYNLENLFDTLDTPRKLDEEFTPTGSRLYNTAVYTDKLFRLSSTLSKIGTDISPEGLGIIGVAEIENRKVLEDLVAQPALKERNMEIVHYESEDFRGIDVALLYQPKYLTVINSYPIHVPILNSKGEKIYTR